MDKWVIFRTSVDNLLKPDQPNHEVKKKWKAIRKEFKNYRPNHLLNLLILLDKSKSKLNSKILDHGCGSGLTLFFLAAQGYKNIWGVDVDNTQKFFIRKKAANKTFKIILESREDRILNYDGKKILFDNASFDYIFSQQVIEHVQNSLLDSYISEEQRILKKNGFALHQIPHKLGPFEGHTKKWFIHWLPSKIYYFILKNDMQKLNLVQNALFLRWPWELKTCFKKYFKSVNNLVSARLKDDVFSEEYSTKERLLRKVIIFLFRLPIVGKLFLRLLSIFFQLELLVQK